VNRLKTRVAPVLLVVAATAALAVLAVACGEQARPVDLRPFSKRVTSVESTLKKVSGLTDQLNAQIVTLQGKDEGYDQQLSGLSTDLSGLKSSVDDLKKSIDSLRTDIQSTKSTAASIQKKLDDLSSRVGGIDQRLWLLDARYNDHLRKYHGGG
jgi:chromosome segregation ATPase